LNAIATENSRSKTLSRIGLVVAGTGLGVALLVLLLRSVNLDQLGSDFSHVNLTYLELAIVPFLINLLLKVPRWALLFGDEAPRWDTLFGSMNVGYAVNSLMPLRLGELVRAYWVRDRTGISMVKALSTIALERVTDGVTLFVLLLVMLPTVAFPRKLLVPALLFGAIFIVVLGFMAALVLSAGKIDHPLAMLRQRFETGRWAVVGKALSQIIAGLQALRNKRTLILLAIYTLIIWGTNSLLIWLVLRAFHIGVPFTAGILLTAVLNLGMAVPSSPGYLGVFDYLMVLTLGLYGVHRTPALAASLGFHAIAFIPVTIIGVAYLGHSGLQVTLRMLRASATR
jgi:uncharacterized protein (TIRG00374 family)